MKLKFEQLIGHLKSQLSHVYLVTGDEPLLVDEACRTIWRKAQSQGYTSREMLYEEHVLDADVFGKKMHNLSLFSEKELLEVTLFNGKLKDKAQTNITQFIEAKPADKVLVIRMAKLDSGEARKKWYKLLEAQGVVVTIWPIVGRDLPNFIMGRLRKVNLATDNKGLQLLAERGENNLLAIVQTIEKLRILYGEGQVSVAQIEAATADQARFDVFDLVNSVLTGAQERVVKILNCLEAENEEPTLILWALTKELRQLCHIKYRQQQGEALERILGSLHLWDKQKLLVKQAASRLRWADCYDLLRQAMQVDAIIKGIQTGQRFLALQQFALAMTEPQRWPLKLANY